MRRFRMSVLALVVLFSTIGVTLIVHTGVAQTHSGDSYALLAEITDGYMLSANSGDSGKYYENGNYDPDVLLRLQRSQDASIRELVSIALDVDALRFRNDLKIVNGRVYEKVPGSRAKRPKRDFAPMVERALPGLQLPYKGQEVRMAINTLRDSPTTGDIFEYGMKGEMMTQIKGILETGLRRRLRNAFEQRGAATSNGGGLSLSQDMSNRALPTITNTRNTTLHHCIIISRIEPDTRRLMLLGGAVQIVDEQARIVFSKNTVDIAKASANLALLDDLQEHGNLCYVPELAPGASIHLSASSTRFAQSMTVSFFSDEIKMRGGRLNTGAFASSPQPNAGIFGQGGSQPQAGSSPGSGQFRSGSGLGNRTQSSRSGFGGSNQPAGGYQSNSDGFGRASGQSQPRNGLGGRNQTHSGKPAAVNQPAGGSKDPLPSGVNQPDTYNILIGDAGEDTLAANGTSYVMKVFKDQLNLNAKYFPARQESEICTYIKSLPPRSKVNLIGHSYGGETAAAIASHFTERCGLAVTMNVLITVDPVSDTHPRYPDIQHAVPHWVNIVADPDDRNEADNLVWDKRWGVGAQSYAWVKDRASHLHHADFEAMMKMKYKGADERQASALDLLLSR